MRGWHCEHQFVVKMAAIRILQYHVRQWLSRRHKVTEIETTSPQITATSPDSQDDSGVLLTPESLSSSLSCNSKRVSDIYFTPPQYLSNSFSVQTLYSIEDEQTVVEGEQTQTAVQVEQTQTAVEDQQTQTDADTFETPLHVHRPSKSKRRVRLSVDQYMHDEGMMRMFTASCSSPRNKNSVHSRTESPAADICGAAAKWIGRKVGKMATSTLDECDEPISDVSSHDVLVDSRLTDSSDCDKMVIDNHSLSGSVEDGISDSGSRQHNIDPVTEIVDADKCVVINLDELEISLDERECDDKGELPEDVSTTVEELSVRFKMFNTQPKRFRLAGTFTGLLCSNPS